MTRSLAKLQTAIVSRGLSLTSGHLDRFAMLSLIVRQTDSGDGTPGRGMPVLSLAASLSAPYETVRRNVAWLIDSGLCERRPGGVAVSQSVAARLILDPVMQHAHAGLVTFVGDLAQLGVPLPTPRPAVAYNPASGVAAVADIMLAVLDGNDEPHGDWLELVVFSAVLCANSKALHENSALARQYANEDQIVPDALIRPVRAIEITRQLGLPETSTRRQLATLTQDGRLLRDSSGYRVSQAWLNLPQNVAVSRASYANVRRILDRLASEGFPFPR